uniref:Uncharacterized protein n=1 Tax=Arundo donax TaxID=35708 RepID=A0A0A9AY31_ARUDO
MVVKYFKITLVVLNKIVPFSFPKLRNNKQGQLLCVLPI